jgi:hypothetical protein
VAPDALANEHAYSFIVLVNRTRASYAYFVGHGSNRIVVPESDLKEKARERRFSWEWRSDEQIIRKGRVYFVTQSHTASATVALTSH